MTVVLELPSDIEAQVAEEAVQNGLPLQEYLMTIIVERQAARTGTAQQRAKNAAALAMLDDWDREDATDDPEEVARRQAEWEQFRGAINGSHTSGRVIYP